MDNDSDCPICFENDLLSTQFTHFPCKHKICNSCFLVLTKIPRRFLFCPYCRTIIPLCQNCKKTVVLEDALVCKKCNFLIIRRLVTNYITTGVNYITARCSLSACLLLASALYPMFFTHDRYLITFDIRFVITCIFSLCMYHFIYE